MIGEQRPRLFSYPQDIAKSYGAEAIELAASASLFLDDWQSFALDKMVSVRTDGKWSGFEFLAILGRQNGKGSIIEARELAGLFLFPSDRLIIHTAHEFKTAEEAYFRVKYLIQNTPDLDRRIKKYSDSHGQEGITLLPSPTIIMGPGGRHITRRAEKRLRFLARSGGSGRGFTGDLVIYDEAMILDAAKVGATLPTLSARPNPQVLYMASAGMITSTQLAKVRRRGVAGSSPSLVFLEWSINAHGEECDPSCKAHDDPDDIRSVARANPALGIRISEDYIVKEKEAMDETEWLRERMGVGQYPAPLDGWLVIPRKWWDATQDNNDDPARPARPVFAVNVSPDRKWASIGLAGARPDGRMGIEVADRRPGTNWVVPRCVELQERWHSPAWIINPRGASGSLVDDLERQKFNVVKLTTQDVGHACGQFFDSLRDDLVWHLRQKPLRDALAGADKRTLSESWAWDEKNAAVDLSPLVAVTFALWGFMKFGEDTDYEARDSVHFDVDEITRLARAGFYSPSDLQRLRDQKLITDAELETVLEALKVDT